MFSILFSLLPRRISKIIAALLVLTTLGVPVGLRLNGDIVIGQVRQIVPLGNDLAYLRIQLLPFGSTARPVVATDEIIRTKQIATGDWVLASGGTRQVEGRPLFTADAFVTSLDASLPIQAAIGNWEARLRASPVGAFIAVLIGCAVLVAGNILVAVATALLFAALCAALTWYVTTATALAGWITLPPMGLYPITATGAVIGLLLGWQLAVRSGSICPRLMAVICMYALLPSMTTHFGWSEVVSYGLLIGSAALPAIAYSIVGALFLGIGLDARGEASLTILAVSACAVLAVQFRPSFPSSCSRTAQA